MTVIKIPYQTLIQHDDDGAVQGAHHQFREVIQNESGVRLAERLLPAQPFGSDPDFPASTLLGQVAEQALALAESRASAVADAEQTRDAAVAARDAAIAERDAALAQVEALTAQIEALTAQPERPPGKWWVNATEFLEEFTPEELYAAHTTQVPLIAQLLMMMLAWTGEVWSADQRIALGLQALVSTGIISPERRTEILAKPTP